MTIFQDRSEAGRRLAAKLKEMIASADILVLALPRGGVPVGAEVARALGAPLDVFLVRKLGLPWHPELAMGAIASGGITVMNQQIVRSMGVSREDIEAVIEQEQAELERRERLYRGDRPAPRIEGRTVVLVDDGLATGSSMRAALKALRRNEPARLVAAVPVGPDDVCRQLSREADESVCLSTPSHFEAVGRWYRRFEQTSDDEVREILDRNWSADLDR